MKRTTFILSTILFLISCKKIPVRSPIQLEVTHVNQDSTKTGDGIEIELGDTCQIGFKYESLAPLDSVYIKFTHTGLGRIYGADSSRIENIPSIGSTKGSFNYTINTNEQYDPALPLDIFSKYVFLKIVLINRNGTVREYKNQITII